jgi:hypothetical protein
VPEVEPPSVREPTMPTGSLQPRLVPSGRRHLVLIASVAVCLLLASLPGSRSGRRLMTDHRMPQP